MSQQSGHGGEHLAPVTYLRPAEPSAPDAAEWTVPGLSGDGPARTPEASGATITPLRGAFASPTEPDGTEGIDGDGSAGREHGHGRGNPRGDARGATRAANVSLAGLSRRNMSKWEIENLLRTRDLDEDTIAHEIARLEGVGLIDDAALAETLVRTQHERKGLGRQAIVAELRRRHIDQEIIDIAVEALDDDDERTRAFELAEKRAGQMSSLDHETAKRRLTGYLQRKGYGSGLVRDAVQHALGSPHRSGVRFR